MIWENNVFFSNIAWKWRSMMFFKPGYLMWKVDAKLRKHQDIGRGPESDDFRLDWPWLVIGLSFYLSSECTILGTNTWHWEQLLRVQVVPESLSYFHYQRAIQKVKQWIRKRCTKLLERKISHPKCKLCFIFFQHVGLEYVGTLFETSQLKVWSNTTRLNIQWDCFKSC